jgi:hypothetical protein
MLAGLWLGGFLELPEGIPSDDSFGCVFAALDPTEFEKGFGLWVGSVMDDSKAK